MAVLFAKMLRFIAILTVFCVSSAVEEVVIVHAPDSVKFVSSEPIHSSYLGDVFSAMLAYTVRSNVEWNSLAVVAPWKSPKALAVLEILGFDSNVDLHLDGPKFLLENAGDLAGQYDLLSLRTEERYFGKSPILLHIDLSSELYDSKIAQPTLLKSVPADPEKRLQLALDDPELGELVQESIFNISSPSDAKLLTELATIKEFLKALSSQKSEVNDGIPDIYWFKIGGLDPIVNTYGSNSFQFREAMRLLRQIIMDMERTMKHVYDDNVVVSVLKVSTAPLPLGLTRRRLLEAAAQGSGDAKSNPYNLAPDYDPMFPVVFIIIAMISIMMILAILGISIAMWTMDPGRDSIIYRMTSTRMKKD